MFESAVSSLTTALKMNCLINEKQTNNDANKNKKELFEIILITARSDALEMYLNMFDGSLGLDTAASSFILNLCFLY